MENISENKKDNFTSNASDINLGNIVRGRTRSEFKRTNHNVGLCMVVKDNLYNDKAPLSFKDAWFNNDNYKRIKWRESIMSELKIWTKEMFGLMWIRNT